MPLSREQVIIATAPENKPHFDALDQPTKDYILKQADELGVDARRGNGIPMDLYNGFMAGTKGLSMGAAATVGLAQSVLGQKEAAKETFGIVNQQGEDIAAENPASVEFKDIRTPSDLVSAMAYGSAQIVPTILASMIPGTVGGAAASKLAMPIAVGIAKKKGVEAAAKFAAKAATAGTFAGMAVGTAPLNIGETAQQLEQAGGGELTPTQAAIAAGAGIGNSVLDMLGMIPMGKALAHTSEVVGKNMFTRAGKTAVNEMKGEIPTEIAQNNTNNIATSAVDPGAVPGAKDQLLGALETGMLVAVTSGASGAGASLIGERPAIRRGIPHDILNPEANQPKTTPPAAPPAAPEPPQSPAPTPTPAPMAATAPVAPAAAPRGIPGVEAVAAPEVRPDNNTLTVTPAGIVDNDGKPIDRAVPIGPLNVAATTPPAPAMEAPVQSTQATMTPTDFANAMLDRADQLDQAEADNPVQGIPDQDTPADLKPVSASPVAAPAAVAKPPVVKDSLTTAAPSPVAPNAGVPTPVTDVGGGGGASLAQAIEAARAVFTRESKKSKAKGHEGRPDAEIQRLAEANTKNMAELVENKSVSIIRSWLMHPPGFNDGSKRAFEVLTGVKLPNTATGIGTAIDQWAGITPEERAQKDAERDAKRKTEKDAKAARIRANQLDATAQKKIKLGGTETTLGEAIGKLADRGFTRVVRRQQGAAFTYSLVNSSTGTVHSYPLDNKDEAELAERILAERKPETAGAEDPARVENINPAPEVPKTRTVAEVPRVGTTPAATPVDALDAELADLYQQLGKKLGQMSSGVDPEIAVIGSKIAYVYVKKGVRKFALFAKEVKRNLPQHWDKVKDYLHGFWVLNRKHADFADIKKDLQDISGDEAEATIAGLDAAADDAKPPAPAVATAGKPEYNKSEGISNEVRNGRIGSDAGGQGALEGVPAPDVSPSTEGGDAGRAGQGSGNRDQRGDRPGTGAPVESRGIDGSGDPAGMGTPPGGLDNPAGGTGLRPGEPSGAEGNRADRSRPVADTKTVAEHVAAVQAETPAEQRGQNYVITQDDVDFIGRGGFAERVRNNLKALRLAKELSATGRLATADEQRTLVRFVGWGGVPQVFMPEYDDLFRTENDEELAKYGLTFRRSAAEKTTHGMAGYELHKELRAALTADEYEDAKRSTLNAHYTSIPIIRAMHTALRRLGVTGGRFIETSAGIGHFLGAAPAYPDGVSWVAVEKDAGTGAILKALYPEANSYINGYESVNLPDNFFDVAMSNVPFGSFTLADPRYDKFKFRIHDYFFAKSLDKVRPGGIIAFITSKGTMDKTSDTLRGWLGRNGAQFVGAIRLPRTAFKGNANTEVVTDMIFLRKAMPGEAVDNASWDTVSPHQVDGETANINKYFIDHPEMVLGKFTMSGKMYHGNELTVVETDGNIEDKIAAAIAQLPKAIVTTSSPDTVQAVKDGPVIFAANELKEGNLTIHDGKVMQKTGVILEDKAIALPKGAGKVSVVRVVSDMIAVRGAVRELLAGQLRGCDDAELATLQKALVKSYDAFVKKHGFLNSKVNWRILKEDIDSPLLMSLEKWNTDKETATKADIFTTRTIQVNQRATTAGSPADALWVTLNEGGTVNLDRVGELVGMTANQASEQLEASGALFMNPETRRHELRDEYLSGPVRKKLAAAEAAAKLDQRYQKNADALRQVQPKDLAFDDIQCRLGQPWIPMELYQEFAEQISGLDVSIIYNEIQGAWNVRPAEATGRQRRWQAKSKDNAVNTSQFGTRDLNAHELLERLLNGSDIKVFTDKAVDTIATAAAKEKAELISRRFQEWMKEDAERADRLAAIYNRDMNDEVPRTYDGSALAIPGLSSIWRERMDDPARAYQKNSIYRGLFGNNMLLAHAVGAGKTLEMASIGMELRRMGLARKPLYVVPNHMLEQWGREFAQAFPAANLLIAYQEDLAGEKRQRFCSKIATGNWDAVIMAHSSFGKIGMSAEWEALYVRDELKTITDALDAARAADAGNKKDSRIVKQLEATKASQEARLAKLIDSPTKDKVVTFEELGIDWMFVDEAHNFKGIPIYTKSGRIPGMQQSVSKRAQNMEMKARYISKMHGGRRGVVFATGTPISNSMSEMYVMMRYLAPDELRRRGLWAFDSWARTYGDITSELEVTPTGSGYRVKERFSQFINLAELRQFFRSFTDVVQSKDLKIKRPEVKGGGPVIHTVKATEWQKHYIHDLENRAEQISKRKVDPKDDNMLKVTTDGRLMALDSRLVDAGQPNDPNGKIAECAKSVVKIWKRTKADKGAQLVFCDLGVPKGRKSAVSESNDADAAPEDGEAAAGVANSQEGRFVVYDALRQLLARHIPSAQIAYIHDAATPEAKEELFAKVRSGSILVLIGNTQRMGEGTNVQERLAALHHLDAPWKPAWVEQRNGRIVRPGNIYADLGGVEIHHYVTEGTFDAYMWQTIERKANFIVQAMDADDGRRTIEDIDSSPLTYSEIKALASGNPIVREKIATEKQLEKLVLKVLAHDRMKRDGANHMRTLEFDARTARERYAKLENEIAEFQKNKPTEFALKIPSGETLTDNEQISARLNDSMAAVRKADMESLVGTYAGVKLVTEPAFSGGFFISVRAFGNPFVTLSAGEKATATTVSHMKGNITSATGPAALEANRRRAEEAEAKLAGLKKVDNDADLTDQHREIERLRARLEEINASLDIGKKDPQAEAAAANEDESAADTANTAPADGDARFRKDDTVTPIVRPLTMEERLKLKARLDWFLGRSVPLSMVDVVAGDVQNLGRWLDGAIDIRDTQGMAEAVRTLDHEVYHHIRNLLLTDAERERLDAMWTNEEQQAEEFAKAMQEWGVPAGVKPAAWARGYAVWRKLVDAVKRWLGMPANRVEEMLTMAGRAATGEFRRAEAEQEMPAPARYSKEALIDLDAEHAAAQSADAEFARQVDHALSRGNNEGGAYVQIGKTPEVLKVLGADDLPLVMTQFGVKKATTPAIADHNLTVEMLKSLPAAMRDPMMVFDSTGDPNALVVVTTMKVGRAPVLAAIKLNRQGHVGEVNIMASAYEKNDYRTLASWMSQGLLRYWDKKTSLSWARTAGLQLPGIVTQKGSTRKVLEKADIFKSAASAASSTKPNYRTAATAAAAAAPEIAAGDEQYWHDAIMAVVRDVPGILKATATPLEGKSDVSLLERAVSLMSHYSEKVPALHRAYTWALNLKDNKIAKLHDLIGYDKTSERSFLTTIKDLRRQDKAEYQKWSEYVNQRDRDAEGYFVTRTAPEADGAAPEYVLHAPDGKDVKTFANESAAWADAIVREVDDYVKAGGTAAGGEALRAFRQIGHNVYLELAIVAKVSQDAALAAGKPPPGVVVTDKNGNRVMVDLFTAVSMMGDRRGHYMPRMRQPGKYKVTGRKPDGRMHSEFRDGTYIPRAGKLDLDRAAAEALGAKLRREGYTEITIEKVAALPESVFLNAGKLMDQMQVINRALEEAVKRGDFKTCLKELEYEGRWSVTKDGKPELLLAKGNMSAEERALMKQYGGQFYDAAGGNNKVWHFTQPNRKRTLKILFGEKAATAAGEELAKMERQAQSYEDNFQGRIERAITQDLLAIREQNRMQNSMASLFAEELGHQFADLWRGHGSRARMIGRSGATGADVVTGYEKDPLLAISMASSAVAGGSAKRETLTGIMNSITGQDFISWQAFREAAEVKGKEVTYDDYREAQRGHGIDASQQQNAYIAARKLYDDLARNSEPLDRAFGTLKALAAFKYLGFRAASAIVNLTSLPTASAAVISKYGKVGLGNAMVKLGGAAAQYAAFQTNGKKAGPGCTKEMAELFHDLRARGWHEPRMVLEATEILQSKWTGAMRTVLNWSMFPMAVTEQINRVTTLAAAYAALKESAAPGTFDHEAAMTEAKRISDLANAVFDKANRPEAARGGGVGAQMFNSWYVFQGYMHNYILTMAKLGFTSKQGIHMLLSGAAIGGIAASPLIAAVLAVIKKLGVDDDPEEALLAFIKSTAGDEAETFARQGPLALAGVDISGSMEMRLKLPTTLAELFGAPGSVVKDIGSAAGELARGNILKGTEKALPGAFGNVARGFREATQGVTTNKNTPVLFDGEPVKATVGEAITRAVSFTPARLSAIREKNWAAKEKKTAYREARGEIYSRLRQYWNTPADLRGEDDQSEITEDIADYNAEAGPDDEQPIEEKDIRRALHGTPGETTHPVKRAGTAGGWGRGAGSGWGGKGAAAGWGRGLPVTSKAKRGIPAW